MRLVKVYIAARSQDQLLAKLCRQQLAPYGIESTARWIDQSLGSETYLEAEQCHEDVRAADALIVIKPPSAHRETTGGHHVETGIALERGMPVVLLGARENVFHHHPLVETDDWPVPNWEALAAGIRTFVASATRIHGDG